MSRVRPRRTRRSRERLTLWVLGCLTVFLGLVTVTVGYVVWSLDQVERLGVAGSLTAATDAPITASDIVAGTDEGAAVDVDGVGFDDFEVHRPDRPSENYLLVGSDSVEGVAAGDDILVDREAESENTLADTIMILRLRPDGTAAIVSIPRDYLVEIAGTGRVALINSSYNIDEAPADRAVRLIDTVEQNVGIDLQHFVEVDLDGFRKLVDAVGGVRVCFDQPIRDRNTDDSGDPDAGGTGFVADAGVQVLDGDQALQYVRSRHLLVQTADGGWERLGYWNDLERNQRQQQFVFDAVDQALSNALSSPNTLRHLLDIVAGDLATSDTISLFDDGIDLARLFRSFDADTELERYALTFFDSQQGGQGGLALAATPDNQRVLDVFRGIGWNDVVEGRVTVEVQGDERREAAASLGELGFQASAASGTSSPSVPVVRYGVGGEQAAVVLASHLPIGVALVGDETLSGNSLVLDLGEFTVEVRSWYRSVALPAPVTVPPTTAPGAPPVLDTAPAPPEPAGVCSP